jgi:hypothetical protein
VDVEPELLKRELRGGVEGVFKLGKECLIILYPHCLGSLLRASKKRADTP